MANERLSFICLGKVCDAAISCLAELLVEVGEPCELCGQRPAEHFIPTPWGDRHVCTVCKESLVNREDQSDSTDF